MVLVAVVVAGEGAPRCLGVYGTYRGAGAGADVSGLVEAVPTAAAGVFGDENEVAPVAGGERSGCAVRLSCDAFRGNGMPDRPMEPEGKSPSRLDMA